jgi:uncharacterized protein YqjF (DUF2071 family)
MKTTSFPMQQGLVSDHTLLDQNRKMTPSHEGWRRLHSRQFEPLFVADWDRAVFLHFAVDAARLQPWVPFPLDCRDGSAWISLVAFTMRGMRPRLAGAPGRWLFSPIATHSFLNVRTYVRHGDEPGIHFLAEWLTNRLAVLLGPRLFGLPYRFGRIQYRHSPESGEPISGSVVEDADVALHYRAEGCCPVSPCARGSVDEFLMERYTAYVAWKNERRLGFFRVWHPPWPQSRIEAEILDRSLLALAPGGGDWAPSAQFVFANFSPGCRDVLMGRPHRFPTEPQTLHA